MFAISSSLIPCHRLWHHISKRQFNSVKLLIDAASKIPILNSLPLIKQMQSAPKKRSFLIFNEDQMGTVSNDELYRLAVAHVQSSSREFGIKLLSSLCEKKHLASLYTMGVLIKSSIVSQDPNNVIKYWSECAEHPNQNWAKAGLGLIYIDGWHVERDVQKGIKLLEESWEPDNEISCAWTAAYNLYNVYRQLGHQDQALHWLKEAADRANDVKAQYNMGVAYSQGLYNLRKDSKLAVNYWIKAAIKKLPMAQHNLGCILCRGEDDLPADYQSAAYFFTQAHYNSFYWSTINLAVMYLLGKGVPKNYYTGLLLLREAQVEGNAEHQEATMLVRKNLYSGKLNISNVYGAN